MTDDGSQGSMIKLRTGVKDFYSNLVYHTNSEYYIRYIFIKDQIEEGLGLTLEAKLMDEDDKVFLFKYSLMFDENGFHGFTRVPKKPEIFTLHNVVFMDKLAKSMYMLIETINANMPPGYGLEELRYIPFSGSHEDMEFYSINGTYEPDENGIVSVGLIIGEDDLV